MRVRGPRESVVNGTPPWECRALASLPFVSPKSSGQGLCPRGVSRLQSRCSVYLKWNQLGVAGRLRPSFPQISSQSRGLAKTCLYVYRLQVEASSDVILAVFHRIGLPKGAAKAGVRTQELERYESLEKISKFS
jgi:hypothetical protein